MGHCWYEDRKRNVTFETDRLTDRQTDRLTDRNTKSEEGEVDTSTWTKRGKQEINIESERHRK